MKLSFNSWLYGQAFGWQPTRSFEDTVDTLAEIGYDGIEIGAGAPHGYPAHLDAARRTEMLEHVADRGLEVSALCPALGGAPGYNPASPDRPERESGDQYIAECIQLAHDLECANVIWLPGWTRYGQDRGEAWRYAAEALEKAAAVAQPLGVHLCIEPTSEVSDVIEHAGDSLRLLDDAGVAPEVAGVMLDSIHVFYRGDDIRAQLREAETGSPTSTSRMSAVRRRARRRISVGSSTSASSSGMRAGCRWRSDSHAGTTTPTASPARRSST